MSYRPLILPLLLFSVAYSIPVDNNVEGEPEIECGPTSITVNFNTRTPFQGHVYVKGLYDQESCRNDEGGRQVAGIELPFDTCNVARTRSLNPKGIFVTTTVVISFHPQFITKVDGAYRIQCFYMEADKTVSADIEVSDLTTHFQTALVPMPICKYEILGGGPTGEPVQYASVGQQVYHKWTCESETTETFCAVVHSCTVDDGNGDRIMILDEDGCALDKFILNNLEYPQDLVAGQEAHVYKYADRNQLFYQCQISISVKEPNAECPRPQCAEARNFGAKKVEGGDYKASSAEETSTASPKVEVSATPSPSSSPYPSSSRSAFSSRRTSSTSTSVAESESGSETQASSSSAFFTGVRESREGALRLLRKKRSVEEDKKHDGVKMLSLDEKNEEDDRSGLKESLLWDGHTVDVRTELTALDFTDAELVLSDLLRSRRSFKYSHSPLISSVDSSSVCISFTGVIAISVLSLLLFVTLLFFSCLLFRPHHKFDDNC